MKIKDYKCKCGHNDFFFADKGSQKGIYCSYCGKWLKWADKDERNLAMKYETKVITRGNCMICGKELTEGLFFCKECEAKAIQGRTGEINE